MVRSQEAIVVQARNDYGLSYGSGSGKKLKIYLGSENNRIVRFGDTFWLVLLVVSFIRMENTGDREVLEERWSLILEKLNLSWLWSLRWDCLISIKYMYLKNRRNLELRYHIESHQGKLKPCQWMRASKEKVYTEKRWRLSSSLHLCPVLWEIFLD